MQARMVSSRIEFKLVNKFCVVAPSRKKSQRVLLLLLLLYVNPPRAAPLGSLVVSGDDESTVR